MAAIAPGRPPGTCSSPACPLARAVSCWSMTPISGCLLPKPFEDLLPRVLAVDRFLG